MTCEICGNQAPDTYDYGGDVMLTNDFGISEFSSLVFSMLYVCRDCGIKLSLASREMIFCIQSISPVLLFKIPDEELKQRLIVDATSCLVRHQENLTHLGV